jgi:hypothetical protein
MYLPSRASLGHAPLGWHFGFAGVECGSRAPGLAIVAALPTARAAARQPHSE